MKETLLSVGIDIGTTTTQMVVSSLKVINTAQPFSVPRMSIDERTVLYRSDPCFTPLLSEDLLDTDAIRGIILGEYEKAGIRPEDVQTGAVIITGETARKENARKVLRDLSELAGEFVVATAGPSLESRLAAKGAGADRYAAAHGKRVLHLDIGGGTTNLAMFDRDGALLDTGCINVGGRLVKYSENSVVTYVSPVLKPYDLIREGDSATVERLMPVVKLLVEVLREAVGLCAPDGLLEHFVTNKTICCTERYEVLSFSGGVSDLINNTDGDWRRYGDIGCLLAKVIGESDLCTGAFVMGKETLRATVIGAGCHATELSGSTIDYSNIRFPVHNVPTVTVEPESKGAEGNTVRHSLKNRMREIEQSPVALSIQGMKQLSFGQISLLADDLAAVYAERPDPVLILTEADMGKALGHALRCRLSSDRTILCLDGIHVPEDSYIDIGAPLEHGSAVPVIVKTLAFM